MKKLMIAAAAVAAAAGAYATTGCCDFEEDPAIQCQAAVYKIQFKLKTLVAKAVKSADDCPGLCYENGNRTVDGLVWSCCDPCTDVNGGDDYQICLWEKASKVCLTDGVDWEKNPDAVKTTWTAKQSFKLWNTHNDRQQGVWQGAWVDSEPSKEVIGTGATEAEAIAAIVAPTTPLQYHEYRAISNPITSKEEEVTPGVGGRWVDTDFAGYIAAYGKKPTKAVAGLADNFGDFSADAVGFGSMGKDGDLAVAKSVSGNCVGDIWAKPDCDLNYGKILDVCDIADFDSWCIDGAEVANVPYSGTWSLKYQKKLNGSIKASVPAYATAAKLYTVADYLADLAK